MKNLNIRKKAFLTLVVALVVTGCTQKRGAVTHAATRVTQQEEVTNTFDYFESDKEEIEEKILDKKIGEAIEKGKEVFIEAVDFRFYGKEIGGVTYDELEEEAKEVTSDNLSTIDSWIMELDPDYKDTVDEKWTIMKDFYYDKSNLLKDKVKETIGSETYEEMKQSKDALKESLKDAGTTVKQKVKEKADSWYQSFKN